MAPTLTVPRNNAELAEMLADPAQRAEILKSPEILTTFVQNYADKHQGDGSDLQKQVEDLATKAFAAFLKDAGVEDLKRPDVRKAMPDPYAAVASKSARAQGLFNRKALGAQVDSLFDSSGEYFNTIWRSNPAKHTADVQEKLEKLRNFSSDIPSDGGFLIPETLRSELLSVALETAIVRSLARVVPMETLRVPFPAIDSTSNVSSVYGGITGFWTPEGGKMTGSKPRFSRVVLDAKKLTAYTEVPSELLMDSLISLTMFIDQMFPEALAFFEDIAFLTGTGVGEPLGALNGKAAVTVARTIAGAIGFDDIVTMFSRMLPQSMKRAVWVASINTLPQLAAMRIVQQNVAGTENVGVASPAVWLNNGQVIDGPPMTIMGRPVIFTEKVPALGSAGDLSLIDFGFYLVGDRQVMQARQSDDFKFDTDEVAFRIIERVDGRPWLQSALTPHNGSDPLSPIVKLGDAA
ncbi:phage major capsid protein [Actinacidiphila sp. DG2A-62]|uniref:phage major capsid protein n=1 Tax=Actinacidiphila sp. DG2A-62 TaxID=3108821 RepID=UPI002DBF0E34|nr:phage major capsid protein [Actinacidiphila sp. DG2A-62]MEC3993993.1 phage major capsid protein [Actinacidiphila sp. DG2A-62]